MKRYILFSIILLSVSVPGRADKVTPQQAAAVAERYLSAESPATKASPGAVRLTGTWPQTLTKGATQEPALYLFERDGGGYVVVAADDVSLPVIGYSTTGRLPQDELPSNLRFMLDWHASMIDYARSHGLKASESTKAQWLSTEGNEGEEVLLETAHWDQSGLPWNAMAPDLDGKECPAGCVATATAIIMRYHQWPEQGTGTLPAYYWYSGQKQIDEVPLDHKYDWSQMPLVYEPGQYTDEQAHQIAQLLYDLAVMCKMNFDPTGSGAEAEAPLALSKYFGYDKQMRFQDWDYYSRDSWEETIRAEINAQRPVYYGGASNRGGHAFVVDGYKGAYFSINYGWGYGSEYYLLRPSVSMDEEAVTEFCNWVAMINHIYPDQGGEVYPNFFDDHLTPFPWDFRSKSFTVGGRNLIYISSQECEVSMGFVLFDREGHFKDTTGEPVLVSSSDPYIPELTCNITCTIEDGDCLKLALLRDGQWEPVQQSANTYLEFHPGKKIKDLLSLDYTLGDEDYPALAKEPYLVLHGVKDIYWEMWSEDKGVCVATSRTLSTVEKVDDTYYTLSSRWDRATNVFRSVFKLPAGTYRLFIRNFDEEMTLYIKL